ncbi:MAG: PD-(D/E)XK nuclease family protein, partial [Bacteroidales bacterium]|nr:PD-(D/E)XK nuclease family protein [Bacteroidales bacterium]
GYTDPYLVALLDSVRDLHFKPMHSLMDLLGWWERNKSSISVSFPEGTNAIRAMTIHKAKGLEFPVVIFPFADLQPEIGKNKKWIPVDDSLMPGIHSMLVSPGKSLLETEYAIHHEEEWSKLQLDTVNLLYVAFTRASESLSIITGISGITSEFSAASFLSGWLKSTGAWSEGKAFYEFGSLIQKTREPDGAKVMEYLPDRWVFGDWRAGMEIRRDAEEWSDQDDHARRWGMQVHEIMAEVATESDLSRVLCQTFAEGHFSREDFSRLQVQLQKIIEDPRLSRYFRPGLRIAREAEILLPGGETYRPDRVVWLEDEVVIIDFKTGRRSPIHASQLNKYEEILEKMGERNIRKLVVYINESNPVVEL